MIAKSLGIDGRSRSLDGGGGQEGEVDPVIGGIKASGREGAGFPVGVEAVAGGRGAGRSAQGTVEKGGGEEARVGGIEAVGVIGDDVRGARGQGDRAGEVDLLPAAGGLIGESGAGEQSARGSPQMADVVPMFWRPL